LLREYKLLGKLSHGVDEAIRKEIENWTPKVTSQTSTSVDLPLSGESRLALLYASQESQTLKQDLIDVGHLVLGLLRVEGCFGAALLRQHGIDLTTYRDFLRTSLSKAEEDQRLGRVPVRAVYRSSPWDEPESENPAPLGIAIARLSELLQRVIDHLTWLQNRTVSSI
jgi:hypothetical protein